MANYKIEIARSAEKSLYHLPKEAIPKVVAAIQGLTFNPYPVGCRKLAGEENIFRIRVQVYRILYEVHQDLILIKVLKVGHRKDVYR